MRNVFFIPPLNKASGGLVQIYELAGMLAESGREVVFCYMGESASGLAEVAASGLLALPWSECALGGGDLWCVPEGWPNALAKGIDAGAKTLLYAQNWVYMLGVLPKGAAWRDLPVEYLAVSGPVAWFMRDVLGLTVSGVLPPLVREEFFRADARSKKHVRIAWMPRKNRAMSKQMREIAEDALHRGGVEPRLEWVEIERMRVDEVAENMASSHIFLMSSMAEGFGLPPAEAMASGCVPVGFAGLGGWEYMISTPLSPCHSQVAASLPPGLVLEDKPWGPNGFYAPEGDVVSGGLALASAIRLAAQDGPEWRGLQAEGRKAAQAYSREAMRRRVQEVWKW